MVEIQEQDWAGTGMLVFGMLLDGRVHEPEDGETAVLLVLLNSYHEKVSFTMPKVAGGTRWLRRFDTGFDDESDEIAVRTGKTYEIGGRTLALFSLQMEPQVLGSTEPNGSAR